MISEAFDGDVYIADFTDYNNTPGVEPLDPFDASYFVQEDMLAIKDETGAFLKAANAAEIATPALIKF